MDACPEVPRATTVTLTADLFAGLHGDVLHFAVIEDDVAAFIQREARGDLVPIFGDQDFDAGVTTLLFVVGGQKDHVAVQPRISAF